MLIKHLRELATTIDRLEHKDRDMMKYLSNKIKYPFESVFRDCSIEIANSMEDLEFAASMESHSDILVTRGKISQEVFKQYHEKIHFSSVESTTDNFLYIVPHRFEPIKEIFKDMNVPLVQNGMRGVTEEIALTKISSEIQDAAEKNNLFRLFTAVSNILEYLCYSNKVGQPQITANEIREWVALSRLSEC